MHFGKIRSKKAACGLFCTVSFWRMQQPEVVDHPATRDRVHLTSSIATPGPSALACPFIADLSRVQTYARVRKLVDTYLSYDQVGSPFFFASTTAVVVTMYLMALSRRGSHGLVSTPRRHNNSPTPKRLPQHLLRSPRGANFFLAFSKAHGTK